MNFMEILKQQANRTQTTNGDLAFHSTFDANVDFFGQAGSKRGQNELVKGMFAKAFLENPHTALMNLYQLRDIEQGSGERELTRACLSWLADNYPKVFEGVVLSNYLSISRWDDITKFATHKQVGAFVTQLVKEQLILDCKDMVAKKPISLLAKWLPTESSKKEETRALARYFANKIFNKDYRLYRKVVSELRQYIGIVETYLTNKDYTFDYAKLPAKASIQYTKAFLRNDKTRFQEFKNLVKENPSIIERKVNKLYPYELLNLAKQANSREYANNLWSALPKNTMNKKCIVVRDGSYSMNTAVPGNRSINVRDVATSLAIYMSERLTGEFKDKFITFSANPALVDLSSLQRFSDKITKTYGYTDCSNTNIEKVYNLLYETALKSAPEDCPDFILILSDMEFDQATQYTRTHCFAELKSTLQIFKEKFAKAGLKMPTMVFWNLNVVRSNFPAQEKERNIFLSGFSKSLMDSIMKMEKIETQADKLMLSILEPKYAGMATNALAHAAD